MRRGAAHPTMRHTLGKFVPPKTIVEVKPPLPLVTSDVQENVPPTLSGEKSLPVKRTRSGEKLKAAQSADDALRREQTEDMLSQVDISFTPTTNQPRAAIRPSNLTMTPPIVAAAVKSSFYGLPAAAGRIYQQRGVRKLYEWQEHVLTRDDVAQGANFVYSLPTSGGKTLVAEVLLMRSLCSRGKSALLVLPFVSIAEEKTLALQAFGDALDFGVEGYYGTCGRFPPPVAPCVFVATIEKANSLLNHMCDEGRHDEIACVVVDELHMVGEPRRGTTLELFLSKVMAVNHRTQIIGMSATVPNLPTIAKWLGAACFVCDFRPVPLKQYSVCDGIVLLEGRENIRNLAAAKDELDEFSSLVIESMSLGSVLIFCASRQQCLDTCKSLAKLVQHKVPHLAPSRSAADQVRAELRAANQDDHCGLLSESVLCGVAFHHGGLLMEERELVERAYRGKIITVLCCTSTLAAGVNLPARRVIFKTPFVGRDFLTKSRYMQMCGRAGRAGMDAFGEAFMMLSRRDRERGHALMAAAVEDSCSTMLDEEGGFAKCLMECIGVRIVTTRGGAIRWAKSLLFVLTNPKFSANAGLVDEVVDGALRELVTSGLVSSSPTDGPAVEVEDAALAVTPFGASAVRSCFTLDEARIVRSELELLQRHGLVMADDIHVCYFLTPVREAVECDWAVYRDILSRQTELRQRIAELIGVDEGFVDQRACGFGGSNYAPANELAKRQHFTARRFYVAMMLSELLNEVPMSAVEAKYHVNRGQLQALLKNASMFSSSITSFCAAMEWFSLEAVLSSFVKRLGFGVKPDIVPLMEIRGVQPPRARALWNAGFKDPGMLASCTPQEVLDRVKAKNGKDNKSAKFFTIKSAVVVVREANRLLQMQIKDKRGELQALTLKTQPPPSAA